MSWTTSRSVISWLTILILELTVGAPTRPSLSSETNPRVPLSISPMAIGLHLANSLWCLFLILLIKFFKVHPLGSSDFEWTYFFTFPDPLHLSLPSLNLPSLGLKSGWAGSAPIASSNGLSPGCYLSQCRSQYLPWTSPQTPYVFRR